MQLSVIIATTDAGRSIEACLRRLRDACADLSAELIVVDASGDDTAARVAALDVPARLLRFPVGTLTPELWAAGYRSATGQVVAFTTGHCLVTPQWATALLRAIDEGASGAGGPLVIAPGVSPLDKAIYYLRYSAFTPETIGAGRIAGEIAGDNAAYRRDVLDRHAATLADGFWEVDFHKLLRADGGWLSAVPSAVVEFGRSFPLATILRHRFAHAVHFGAGRVGGGRSAAAIALASPLVPLVLTARAGRRVIRNSQSFWNFAVGLPAFLLLSAAWAFGEAWGAVAPAHLRVANRAGQC